MKKLMLGNESLARGLYEANVKFISSYPGTPSTEITEFSTQYDSIYAEWAPNEKVAMESAFGAALSGKRSFCAMKHVGLNVAADPLYTMAYTGVNAGMVICVADDPGMHSSQNEQDSRYHAIASKVPMLEPSDSAEAKEFVKYAYEISEKFDTPVIIRMCTRIAHSQSLVELEEQVSIEDKEYVKTPGKFVAMPANAKRRHPIVEQHLIDIKKWSYDSSINKIDQGNDKSLGIITHSTSYQYIKEALGEKHPVLKIGMTNPLPDQMILDFCEKVDKVIIVEELDGVIEKHCLSLGIQCEGKNLFGLCDELLPNKVAEKLGILNSEFIDFEENIPMRPPILCPGCPHRSLFYVLKSLKLNVLGDIGCYTLGAQAPLSSVDTTLCMGSGISSLHGFTKLSPENRKKSVAVIGDSTFVHSGITSLINICYNKSNSTVIVLDNSITGMTGHQQNPSTGLNIYNEPAGQINLEELCKSIGVDSVVVVDPFDIANCKKIIAEEIEKDCSSVIISRRPCALLKTVKFPGAIQIDSEKCKGCKKCMTIGCPAISFKDKRAVIDPTLCVGCGVCTQLCKFDAIPVSENVEN